MASSHYLSARTSKGLVPRDQLRTIQAESIAARKPRAIPVPIGQKGCKGKRQNSSNSAIKEGSNPATQSPPSFLLAGVTPVRVYLSAHPWTPRRTSCHYCLFTMHGLYLPLSSLRPSVLTSRRLSPTKATSNWCPFCSRTKAAFSEAYMQVKSNMATSGCP